MIDQHDEPEAGLLTPAQQDHVADACFQCSLCVVECPYQPGLHEYEIDIASLMLRSVAMQHANGHRGARTQLARKVLGRPGRVGRVASRFSGSANRFTGAEPGSLLRKLTSLMTGVSPTRRLAPFAQQCFSQWFAQRPRITLQKRQAEVTLYPTCLVEYQATDVGKDLVKVYERNGVECRNSQADCCGAPLLHAGDVAGFTKAARRNVAALAGEIRRGGDVVVPQPTCAAMLTEHYVEHLRGTSSESDAMLVAARTHDANAYLMQLHREDDYVLDTDFDGETHRRITYQVPSHIRAGAAGVPGRDLMKLTGARVHLVQQSSGVEGIWGLRAGNEAAGGDAGARLAELVERAGADAVAADCHFAHGVIAEHTGVATTHPLQIVARAYGIPEER
ncbi:MAG: heterodisulfide reductase-related iron-sulfur binding cluster [Ilumatobacter sp.]